MFTTVSIPLAGRTVSVRMEDEFWDCLRDIAADCNITLGQLLKTITAAVDNKIDGRVLASVLRVYALEYAMEAAGAGKPGK